MSARVWSQNYYNQWNGNYHNLQHYIRPQGKDTTTTFQEWWRRTAMTCMRARRKRLSSCIWKSILILTEQIMKRRRLKTKDPREFMQGTPMRKGLRELGDFWLYHQHLSMLHSAILWHDVTTRLSALLALPTMVVHLTAFNCFSIITFLTYWYKIRTSMLQVKMPEVMGLDTGSLPQFLRWPHYLYGDFPLCSS